MNLVISTDGNTCLNLDKFTILEFNESPRNFKKSLVNSKSKLSKMLNYDLDDLRGLSQVLVNGEFELFIGPSEQAKDFYLSILDNNNFGKLAVPIPRMFTEDERIEAFSSRFDSSKDELIYVALPPSKSNRHTDFDKDLFVDSLEWRNSCYLYRTQQDILVAKSNIGRETSSRWFNLNLDNSAKRFNELKIELIKIIPEEINRMIDYKNLPLEFKKYSKTTSSFTGRSRSDIAQEIVNILKLKADFNPTDDNAVRSITAKHKMMSKSEIT